MTLYVMSILITVLIVVVVFLKLKKLNKNIIKNTNDILTYDELKIKLEDLGLIKYWAELRPLIRNEIRIFPFTEKIENKQLGRSKMGGRPDLPLGINWFKDDNDIPLSFIAQINLKEIKKYDKNNLLPEEGILYFFYSATQEAWGGK